MRIKLALDIEFNNRRDFEEFSSKISELPRNIMVNFPNHSVTIHNFQVDIEEGKPKNLKQAKSASYRQKS